MDKFKEYDAVKSTKQLIANTELFGRNDVIVPAGTGGTILLVFEGHNHYEVEFMDSEGESLAVITVSEADIEKE